jgi:chemotaxis protein methyltransferase WspC
MTLERITALLSQRIGIDAQVIGDRRIAKAIETRRSAGCFSTIDAYLTQLQASQSEFDELVELLVVPETSFFRDRKPFDFLVKHLKSQVAEKGRLSKLRVLSAPCSTGEEPYSIAIALLEAGLSPHQFKIDAIDISRIALDKAKRAIYGKNSFRGVDWVDRDQYFLKTTEQGIERYKVCSEVRSLVKFRQGNLLEVFTQPHRQPTPLGNITQQYDIIFCRNLLIYLEKSVCQELFKLFHQLLSPEGLLFVGAAETSKVPIDHFSFLRQSFAFAYCKISSSAKSNPFPQPQISKNNPKSIPSRASPLPVDHSFKKSLTPKGMIESKQELEVDLKLRESSYDLDQVQSLADAGHLEEAIHLCKTHLKTDRINPKVYKLLGNLYQAVQNYGQSELYFKKAIYLEPNDDESLLHLALIKTAQGDTSGADRLYQRLKKISVY